MTLVEIAIGTVLRIPSAWRQFVYRGFLYERDACGRFVVRAKVEAENKSVLPAKSA